MKTQRSFALALLPAAILLTSCGTKPATVSTPPMPPSAAQNNRTVQNMVYPTNPNRPANVPALGIPANARHGGPGRPPGQ